MAPTRHAGIVQNRADSASHGGPRNYGSAFLPAAHQATTIGANGKLDSKAHLHLKQRGLPEETLVVWGGEFGRIPIAGRDFRLIDVYGEVVKGNLA